jgi:23S rRNA (pseudouridine1915-N3)-methyltransferase
VKLRIVALGHKMPAWVTAGYDEYARRMPREVPLELVELKPEARDRGKPVAQMLATEAQRIRAVAGGRTRIALDERGAAWTTRMLADRLRTWQDAGDDVNFVIGSADGLDASIKEEATAVFALSALTLPHGLVRVVLAEQLYRALSLNAGHPYHRD